ncbi:hypothetical protein [Streptomyces sp. NPDC056707]|uniref:hypothetical protein n=1 Tax=Streptomyces sp. NPDC056707 TaxID=3345919 RepID=UPI003698A0AA
MQPSIGRVVLVPMDPATNNGASVAPAIITRVWTGTSINVQILADAPGCAWRTSLTHVESLDGLDDAHDRLYRWTWPPKVGA